MIKGVNHRVVEVSDTGSKYFDKIMFFVSPDYAGISEGKIREKAGAIAKCTSAPPHTKSKRKSLSEILVISFTCLCFMAVGIILGKLG